MFLLDPNVQQQYFTFHELKYKKDSCNFCILRIFKHIISFFSTHLKKCKILSFSIVTFFAHRICEFYENDFDRFHIYWNISVRKASKISLKDQKCKNLDIVGN